VSSSPAVNPTTPPAQSGAQPGNQSFLEWWECVAPPPQPERPKAYLVCQCRRTTSSTGPRGAAHQPKEDGTSSHHPDARTGATTTAWRDMRQPGALQTLSMNATGQVSQTNAVRSKALRLPLPRDPHSRTVLSHSTAETHQPRQRLPTVRTLGVPNARPRRLNREPT
jgi:hypothetical protein